MTSHLPDAIALLAGHLPALAGEALPTTDDADEESLRPAAVLVLLFPRGSEFYLPLTVRPETMKRHPGQISLPGGMYEPQDADLACTALREAQEELGIDPNDVQLLGRLPAVQVQVSKHIVVPFVGWTDRVPVMRPDPREVAAIVEMPLSTLIDPNAIVEEVWELHGQEWLVTFYRVGTSEVWGVTARILSQLAGILHEAMNDLPWLPGSVRPSES